jgi:hypothetical protein
MGHDTISGLTLAGGRSGEDRTAVVAGSLKDRNTVTIYYNEEHSFGMRAWQGSATRVLLMALHSCPEPRQSYGVLSATNSCPCHMMTKQTPLHIELMFFQRFLIHAGGYNEHAA